MKIVVETGVIEYLEKAGTNGLVIDMLPERTSGGCGCGKTKKFYTPYIRPTKNDEQFRKDFQMLQIDGIKIFVVQKAFHAAEDTITIFIEKTLLIKKLQLKGIPLFFD